jgi:hypothetical protein
MIQSNPIVINVVVFVFAFLIGLAAGYGAFSSKEKFCNCQGMITQVCPNPAELVKLYNSGELTEFTDLNKFSNNKRNNFKMTIDQYQDSYL